MIRDLVNRIRSACKAAERGPQRAGPLSTHRGEGAARVAGTLIAVETLHALDRYPELQKNRSTHFERNRLNEHTLTSHAYGGTLLCFAEPEPTDL